MMRTGDLEGWARAKFCIEATRVQDPDTKCRTEVDGIICAGLGMHLANDRAHVTHLASGRRVASFSTLGGAMEFAYRVKDLADWHQLVPLDMSFATRGTDEEVMSIAAEIERKSPRPREVTT